MDLTLALSNLCLIGLKVSENNEVKYYFSIFFNFIFDFFVIKGNYSKLFH